MSIQNPNGQTSPPTAAGDITAWDPNFEAFGITSIIWGTEFLGGLYIVVSASESARIEEINIEQGAGFEAIVILLNKGLDVEIEVIDDTAVTPPTIASSPFTLVTPFGLINNLILTGSKASQARKREGMRTLTFKSFTAITSFSNGARTIGT